MRKPSKFLLKYSSNNGLLHFYFARGGRCEVLRWVRLCVCVCACLSVRVDISGTTRAIFTKFFVHVVILTNICYIFRSIGYFKQKKRPSESFDRSRIISCSIVTISPSCIVAEILLIRLFMTWSSVSQTDLATRYVSQFVLCFTSYGSYKGFKQQRWLSRSLKGISNGAIR